MVAFLNSLPQDKKTTITEDDKHITDGLGAYTPVYTTSAVHVKLINSPLTIAEKDSIVAHYKTNIANEIDLIVNQYGAGTIQVYYSKAPKLKQVGRIHWSVTSEFKN